jgi:hypothetical protein
MIHFSDEQFRTAAEACIGTGLIMMHAENFARGKLVEVGYHGGKKERLAYSVIGEDGKQLAFVRRLASGQFVAVECRDSGDREVCTTTVFKARGDARAYAASTLESEPSEYEREQAERRRRAGV